jgi:hypothetical protein
MIHASRLPLVVVTAFLTTLVPDRAEACGGLFCDAVQPVNQVGEQILFVDHGDGRVTAVVQIAYSGPAESFAWVLPVYGVPEIDVSSNLAFARLAAASNPTYTMTTDVEGECAQPIGVFGGCASEALASAGDGDGDAGAGAPNDEGITVVDQGSVGPYDYTVIQVNPALDDLAQEALDWLTENGYQADAIGADLIRPYLEETMNLVAFRLTKNASTGDIRPVVMTYESDTAMIPIKLTAVATVDNMGVLVWTTGTARAVPTNYLSLVPNDALLNWFAPMSNYNDLVTAAADEAGGHGFVTEHATTTASMAGTIFTGLDTQNWENLQNSIESATAQSAVEQVLMTFPGWDGTGEALRAAGVDEDAIATITSCPFCGVNAADVENVTVPGLVAAWDEHVLAPLRATEALFIERPFVTRLYSTLSASEMTVDPAFDFNPDLPDVDNVHTANRTVHCGPDVTFDNAPWSASLPSGEVVFGRGFTWPIDFDDEFLPKNRAIYEDATSGQPIVVANNATSISARLEELNDEIVPSSVMRGCTGVGARVGSLGELALVFGAVFAWRSVLRRRRE